MGFHLVNRAYIEEGKTHPEEVTVNFNETHVVHVKWNRLLKVFCFYSERHLGKESQEGAG